MAGAPAGIVLCEELHPGNMDTLLPFSEAEVGIAHLGFVSLGLSDLSLRLADKFHNSITPQSYCAYGHAGWA